MKKTPSFWAQNPGNSSAQPYSQAGPKLARRLGPAFRARRPHPGRNLGLGRQSRATARARLGQPAVQSRSTVGSDRTAERSFRPDKNSDAARVPETLGHSAAASLSLSSSPLSPLSTSSLLSATATESDDGERACSGATIAPSPAPSPARVLPNG